MGSLKVGDLVTDVLFIITMSKFNDIMGDPKIVDDDGTITDEKAVNPVAIIAFAAFFTLLGFIYDMFTARHFLKFYREENGLTWAQTFKLVFIPPAMGSEATNILREQAKKQYKRKCWWRANVFYEEIPQFLMLAGVSGGLIGSTLHCSTLGEADDKVRDFMHENCTQEQIDYSNDLFRDAMISLLFTGIALIRSILFYLNLLKRCCCGESLDTSNTNTDADSQV